MPSVGLVLVLIGLWVIVRTLAGGLAQTLTRGATEQSKQQTKK